MLLRIAVIKKTAPESYQPLAAFLDQDAAGKYADALVPAVEAGTEPAPKSRKAKGPEASDAPPAEPPVEQPAVSYLLFDRVSGTIVKGEGILGHVVEVSRDL